MNSDCTDVVGIIIIIKYILLLVGAKDTPQGESEVFHGFSINITMLVRNLMLLFSGLLGGTDISVSSCLIRRQSPDVDSSAMLCFIAELQTYM